ncbi:hypothetical protein PGT21_011524 [Puccinia graminis f. sp. tritici]|uniref:Uncharacterized protein n=1 Tax=Puccinia graminis f. sp. tritici TaxID=56615 RepID=A0A5B0N3M6_PUCGR|nr:hypothetical protein PGT21_011524 [Puccinia graminis f. sp. tritici]
MAYAVNVTAGGVVGVYSGSPGHLPGGISLRDLRQAKDRPPTAEAQANQRKQQDYFRKVKYSHLNKLTNNKQQRTNYICTPSTENHQKTEKRDGLKLKKECV